MKLNLDIPAFLQQHWQQQPCVIRQAIPEFEDPIEPDELAGLALEESVSSRIVIRDGERWFSESGGREDYNDLGGQDWQLLVQAVNHHHGPAQSLCEQFRFLPDWRFDDLMVSFAVPGGGVGPHIDNYDVFILQGQGERRWQVGQQGSHRPRPNCPGMALVEDFEPIIDVVMQPGDLLYIPPGFPHCGQTLTPSLSYSLGYRAPSQQELLGALADHLLDSDQGKRRFTSSSESAQPGVLSLTHQKGMMTLLQSLFDDPAQWQDTLGRLLSQNRFELDPWPPSPALTQTEIAEALGQDAALYRLAGLKVLQLEGAPATDLYLDGERYSLPEPLADTATLLANRLTLEASEWRPLFQLAPDTLLEWLNLGYWQLDH
ncbi:cupin domain-containing protein [Ferrimonas balearica]|uniref:cupin domain-containing protein n=1 Tax=Ferrimonas balearica TaxID=44012 RepID=UPI001C9A03F3|nr:cupin domain-containing protein [Ferrimonas balearica]MBY5920315.1 cupin domain-containing protein [Ferrimonas balearica]MBY5997000.1 cupin domain-containing protein [Ferrimonas balearica]